jgi:hypothetical protein
LETAWWTSVQLLWQGMATDPARIGRWVNQIKNFDAFVARLAPTKQCYSPGWESLYRQVGDLPMLVPDRQLEASTSRGYVNKQQLTGHPKLSGLAKTSSGLDKG